MTELYLATEDPLSEAVADRLVLESGPGLQVAVRMGRQGNGYLRKKLPELIRLAQKIPVFLLTDLDRCECPIALINSWDNRGNLPAMMLFRVAVRETEAWILADGVGLSEFSGIPQSKIPSSPETLDDPKRELINLISRYGKKSIKQKILPAEGAMAKVSSSYNSTLSAFVKETWDPARAATRADSLARARTRLNDLRG